MRQSWGTVTGPRVVAGTVWPGGAAPAAVRSTARGPGRAAPNVARPTASGEPAAAVGAADYAPSASLPRPARAAPSAAHCFARRCAARGTAAYRTLLRKASDADPRLERGPDRCADHRPLSLIGSGITTHYADRRVRARRRAGRRRQRREASSNARTLPTALGDGDLGGYGKRFHRSRSAPLVFPTPPAACAAGPGPPPAVTRGTLPDGTRVRSPVRWTLPRRVRPRL